MPIVQTRLEPMLNGNTLMENIMFCWSYKPDICALSISLQNFSSEMQADKMASHALRIIFKKLFTWRVSNRLVSGKHNIVL